MKKKIRDTFQRLCFNLGILLIKQGGFHIPRTIRVVRCMFVDMDNRMLFVYDEESDALELSDYAIIPLERWHEIAEAYGIKSEASGAADLRLKL